jgi:rare lipoprotein A
MRGAGVIPHNVHPTTWIAALTVAVVCVAAALYIGEKAAAYLPDKITITSWQPPRPARDLAAPEPTQSSNLAKKTAREPFRHHEARLAPEADRSRFGATRQAPQDEVATGADAQAPQDAADDTIEENASAAETGRASWYDLETPTASGEQLDDGELTAAHRSAPFGTKLRVVNLKNGREVVVRVNDRGPFAKDRIIDLSKAAAMRLGMIADGVADVRVTPVADQFARNSGAGG